MRFIRALLPILMFLSLSAAAQDNQGSVTQRFEEIRAKHRKGEQLTPEEERFAKQYMARRNQQGKQDRFEEYAKSHPPKDSTGLVPLTDLGSDNHKGWQGGLYPNGMNEPPETHLQAGLSMAAEIAPLDCNGKRDQQEGKVVLLSIGMSNTTQEYQAFESLAKGDPELNPRLVIVDGAQGGQTARVTGNPSSNFWKVVDQRLDASGVTRNQVQAAWLKQANAGPTGDFPVEVLQLKNDIIATLHNMHALFPNLKAVYLSSRIYAGYAASPLNPEPHAYESGFAVQQVIADQIAGKAELNYDRANGDVKAPWVCWGPYLWTDGLKGRTDGLTWAKNEVAIDGTHPSPEGQKKVAELLMKFLKSSPTSRPWFLAKK